MTDAATLAVVDILDLATDQLRKALAAIQAAGVLTDEPGSGWALQSAREILDTATGAAEMITAEATHMQAVKATSVDYTRRAAS